MTLYDRMLTVNDELLAGRQLTDEARAQTAGAILSGVSDRKTTLRFHDSVNAPRMENGDPREMYPLYFIPPYRDGGAKLRTLTGALPGTNIYSANAYELELLRLAILLAPDDANVRAMTERTVRRLDSTCFGRFCEHGECYDTAAPALRFICAADKRDLFRQSRLVSGLMRHHADKRRAVGTELYILLALTDCAPEVYSPHLRGFYCEALPRIERSVNRSNADARLRERAHAICETAERLI